MKKKIIVFCLAISMLLCMLTGCSSAKKEAVPVITEYTSLAELNDAHGSRMFCVNDATVTDEAFYTINGDIIISEYDYTDDGRGYIVRFCADPSEDVANFYVNDVLVSIALEKEEKREYASVKSESFYVAHWCTVDGQYLFATLNIEELAFDDFNTIALDYMNGTILADD